MERVEVDAQIYWRSRSVLTRGENMRRERYNVWMGTINYEHKTIGKEVYMGE